jgi:hypothetical protein
MLACPNKIGMCEFWQAQQTIEMLKQTCVSSSSSRLSLSKALMCKNAIGPWPKLFFFFDVVHYYTRQPATYITEFAENISLDFSKSPF